MSNTELPKTIDPYKFADQNSTLEGFVPLAALGRFAECIVAAASSDPQEQCQVALAFSKDEERRRIVSGELSAEVMLECQRCMKPMPVTLTSSFRLALVTSDAQAQQLPRELEPFQTDGFTADLWTMVEDELLLVLPPFPLHERKDCQATEVLETFEADPSVPDAADEERENPFSVLADLKKRRH
ncbi:YceD family protein [Marinobacter salicampi]|uniref:YceD family protein n=1 Tax=Marinobacter salicampi TaxID=435907 RepID=UPI00140C0B88|nr:YceD family protein [Marinobacter salicampi]